MPEKEFTALVRKTVGEYTNTPAEDVYIVWMCKTLQNSKALASTNKGDGLYFELTYNGNKRELYVDVYRKEHNCVVVV